MDINMEYFLQVFYAFFFLLRFSSFGSIEKALIAIKMCVCVFKAFYFSCVTTEWIPISSFWLRQSSQPKPQNVDDANSISLNVLILVANCRSKNSANNTHSKLYQRKSKKIIRNLCMNEAILRINIFSLLELQSLYATYLEVNVCIIY